MNAYGIQPHLHTRIPLHKRTVFTLHLLKENVIRKIVPEKSPLSIGRSANQDIQIIDGKISRNHVELFTDGRTWYVVDCGSTNGTTLDGVRLLARQPVCWEPTAVLKLGDALLTLDTMTVGATSDPVPVVVQAREMVSDETIVADPLQLKLWMTGFDITLSITNPTNQPVTVTVSAESGKRIMLDGEGWEATVPAQGETWLPFQYSVLQPLLGRTKTIDVQFDVTTQTGNVQSATLPIRISPRLAHSNLAYFRNRF